MSGSVDISLTPLQRSQKEFLAHPAADLVGCACCFMVGAVYLGEVADVKAVDEGKIYLGIFDVDVSLKLAGILHGHIYLFFSEVIFAEDIQTEFLEFTVES